jgi:hypothetical protein
VCNRFIPIAEVAPRFLGRLLPRVFRLQ